MLYDVCTIINKLQSIFNLILFKIIILLLIIIILMIVSQKRMDKIACPERYAKLSIFVHVHRMVQPLLKPTMVYCRRY